MERIAVISDIHGNLEALNTVLDDIKKRDIDRIICLGDILAKGRHFSECIKIRDYDIIERILRKKKEIIWLIFLIHMK